MKLQIPELLMPAGDAEKAFVAFKYGADAIYCGLPMFSLRTRENVFTEPDLQKVIEFARKNGKKVYVTLNAFPHDFLIPLYQKHLEFLEKLAPDGIIFADLGVLSLATEFAPSVPKHLSVQTSTLNAPAIKMWQKMGVSRIICAREMSVREVAAIHQKIPEMELEYFVHGSVCMAYSGRCLLSNFSEGRDANRGACNHTCRWNYRVFDDEKREVDVSDHFQNTEKKSGCGCKPKKSQRSIDCGESGVQVKAAAAKSLRDFEDSQLVESEKDPGAAIPIEEDFHGTHIMSSRDMCMIEDLENLTRAGVCSLKVEGRNKTAYYVATIARAYRAALDDLAAGRKFDPKLWNEIHATANRGFFPGFLHGKPQKGDIQFEANRSVSHQEFAAVVQKWTPEKSNSKNSTSGGRAEILVKNRIFAGDSLEFVAPKIADDFQILAANLQFGGQKVDVLHGGNQNQVCSISCPRPVEVGTFVRQKTRNPSQLDG